MLSRRPALALGILSIALELPLVAQLFFLGGDSFDWGWLFIFALAAPWVALTALVMSVPRRDWMAMGAACLGLGGLAIPLLVAWAIVSAFQQG